MASKLIELQDGTLVEIDVPENKAKLISGGAVGRLQRLNGYVMSRG